MKNFEIRNSNEGLRIRNSKFEIRNSSPSNLLRLVLPKQSARPEQKDGDEDHERDGIAKVREPRSPHERLDHPDDQPSHHRPRHIADAPQDRGDEGFEAWHDAH